jgi:outer membrane protein OmpA-like peptidoglycan-associated protein
MKNLYITLGFLMATASLSAQSKETEYADKLFGRFEYVDAAKEYLKLTKKGKDPYVYRQLAESYFNVYNSKEAVVWYAKAIDAKKQDAETYYKYAQMLKAEGNYAEYNNQMKEFAKLAPKDQRAVAFNEDPDYLPKLKSQTKMFDEKLLDINDKEYGSFGAVLVNDGTFYFTSNRNTTRKTYGRDEQPYLDIYTATYNADGSISQPVPLSNINTQHHDGPIALSPDGNTMYFASESFREGESEKVKGQRNSLIYLYKANKENGKWGSAVALPFNNKAWNTNHPSVSKDGKWLYFSSNRKGSLGGADIWKVEIKGGNSYGEPLNLGKKINTEGNEGFPFVTDDNKLFFASDGHKGLGGLDIFYTDLAKEGSDAINVGLPVNSAADDFSFSLNQQKNVGFFSSNRTGKKGDQMGAVDNMYKAIPICGVDAAITVKDKKTGQVIKAASVAILDDKNNVIETRTTDANGVVTYSVDCNKGYQLVATSADYETSTVALPAQNGGKKEIVAELVPLESMIVGDRIVLKDIYFDFDKSNITQKAAEELDKLVQIMKSKPNLVIMVKAHTDTKGSAEYNMRLSNERAISAVQYVLSNGIAKERISGQGYGKSEPRIVCEPCTAEQDAENRRIEFIIVKGL